MQRRTLDILFSIGGLLLAVLLLVLGLVLKSNADFANDYVEDQLSAQQIFFTEKADLTEEEAAEPCVVANAGQQLTTGKQAECYANSYIGLHLAEIGGGETYASLGGTFFGLQAQLEQAKADNAANVDELQEQFNAVAQQRETLFKGETLRGVLLTSYGFSEFGRKAQQAAWVCFLASLVLLIASIAGFVHALRTPKDKGVGEVQHTPPTTVDVS